MAREWNPNPGDPAYWRSDNPCIERLYLLGDDEPAPPVPTINGGINGPWSAARKDSGPSKYHFTNGTTPQGGSFEANIGVMTSGIAPSQTYPPEQRSGLLYNGSNWTAGGHTRGFGSRNTDYLIERSANTTHGGYGGVWSFANMSGMTMCGWAYIAPTTTNQTTWRLIAGIRRQLGTTQGGFGLFVRPSDGALRFEHYFANGSFSIGSRLFRADTPGPNHAPIGENFFFAAQISRNRGAEQGMAYDTCAGSGEVRIMVGTDASGLIDLHQEPFFGTNICGEGVQTAHHFSVGSVGLQVDGGNQNNHVPPNSILDDIAVLNDAPHPCGLEVLRINGWKHVPETSDPEHSSFVPVSPGTDELVGYWDWSEEFVDGSVTNQPDQSFVLPNKAPATSGIAPIAFAAPRQNIGNGATFGGTGNTAVPTKPFTGKSMRPNLNGGGGQITGVSTSNQGVFIPVGSGANYIFPEVKPGKEGWTWIFWGRSICNFIFGTGTCHDAHDIGWQHKTETDGSCKWTDNSGESAALNQGRVNCAYTGSGVNKSSRLYFPLNVPNSPVLRRIPRNEWRLRAVQWQTDAPMVHCWWEGQAHQFCGQRVSPLSGFSKEFHSTADESVFRITHTGPTLSESQWGPVAIYNRILSVAEMSGFANSGVETPPIVSPFYTNFKQTFGYWPADAFTTYDPEAVSGLRIDDESWYRHHLTNISGVFGFNATALNPRIASQSLEVQTSGAMVALERVFTGANLDQSTIQAIGPSGFSAGCWMYLPSGDLETQGNGSSGLFGEHMFMGNWSQDENEQSWFLGMQDGNLEARFKFNDLSLNLITTTFTPAYETPFFVGLDIQPSGSVMKGRIVYSESFTDNTLEFIGENDFGSNLSFLNSAGASGFSLLNIPHKQAGFPSGTRLNSAFMYGGAPIESDWILVKKAGVNETALGSGSVSVTDPDNISLWPFDFAGSRFLDRGKENNTVFPINQDGNGGGVIGAIHGSGVVIRRNEYYDTLPFNSNSRRLDLGSGNQSWTFLTWVLPPEISNSDRHYIMAKSDGLSGIQVFTPSDTLQLTTNASGNVGRGENGDLAPGQWNHVAVVYDRDNNELTSIINGRYAGTTFEPLTEIPTNNSGLALGGRGDQQFFAVEGGSAFSGYLDDTMLFSRALSLPEISGLAANSYNYDEGLQQFTASPAFGGYLSGLPLFVISGLIGSFLHGQAQDLELFGGYVSGVSGLCVPYGGFIHGKAQISGAPAVGHFLWGKDLASGVFGHFVHGLDIVSGFIGHYEFGACRGLSEFDVTLNFSIFTADDFDARLGVEKTQLLDFDAKLGVLQVTQPPECTLEMPLVGEVGSGTPYSLTVQGSGYAFNNKSIAMTRFTFADFKGAESGTLIQGQPNSGLFEATRELDTPGWYTVKIEVLDSFGYRTSCCRPFLLLPSGSTSGAFINSLPGVSIEGTPQSGTAIHTVSFTHSISGLTTTSGVLEYTDFADQQESLVNSLEMPVGTQFVDFVRRHDYTMPGRYCPVWAVSGEFGIVSDTIADGIDYLT